LVAARQARSRVGAGGRGSAGLGDDVDQGRFAFHRDFDCPADGWTEILGISNGALSVNAHPLGDLGVIDVGIVKGRADSAVINPALVPVGHTLEVHELLMIRAIVVHDAQERDLVMRGGPQDSRGVHDIAIILEVDSQASVLSIGKRRTGGGRSAVADACSSGSANILVVLVERPQP